MPATASSQVLTSVRTVGGLLPADMLIRIAEGKDVSGSRPADYHVVGVRSVQDAAERHWDYLKGAWRALRDAIGDAGQRPVRARPSRTGCCRCSRSTASAAWTASRRESSPTDRTATLPGHAPVAARPDPPGRLGHRPGPQAARRRRCRRSRCCRNA